MPSFSSSAPTNGVTTTLAEGKDMAGGGRGGHVVFPHPDNEEAGRLLDDVGSTNANDDDNDDTPPPPPKTTFLRCFQNATIFCTVKSYVHV
jgi:hypothetical protein